MVDRSKPLPTSLQNEFIPEEVLLSLTNAANAGPCPENLLPPKKIKTPQVCVCVCVCVRVCVCVYKVLGNIYLDIQFIKYLFNMFYIPDCLKDILKLIS